MVRRASDAMWPTTTSVGVVVKVPFWFGRGVLYRNAGILGGGVP